MKTVQHSFIFILIIFSVSARADLDFEDNAFPEFVNSARALAMGNAYICKVDDSWSAFYNPAGLGTVRKPQFQLGNLHFEASNGLGSIVAPGSATEAPTNYLKTFNPESLRDLLLDNRGQLVHSRFNIFPNITLRGMTMGYFYSQRNRSIINNENPDPNHEANTFEVLQRQDQGPVFSLSGSLLGGIFKFGASATYLIRSDLAMEFTPSDSVSISDSDYKTGRSLQLNVGTRLSLPFPMLPTFAAVLRNATGNDWESPSNNGGPDRINQTLDVGFSISPQIGKLSRMHLEFNIKDMNNSYDSDIKRRMAAGMEIDYKRRVFFRSGYGDGWGSIGIGVRNRTFSMDLTTYAVDRSLDGFRKDEDRRWAFSISSAL